MIFVTVGTSSWDFMRLIKEMDRIAVEIDEEVIMQISHIEYEPKNAKYFRFTSNEEIEELYKNARVVVSHAGVGCIIAALKYNKPNIVVPRREEYGEHFDDHQVQIAKKIKNNPNIYVVYDVKELKETIAHIKPFLNEGISTNRANLIKHLRDYLARLDKNNKIITKTR